MKEATLGHAIRLPLILLAATYLLLACTSKRKNDSPNLGGPSVAFGGGMNMRVRPVDIVVRTPALNWDIQLIDIEDFFPSGAKLIEGAVPYPNLFEDALMSFEVGKEAILHSPDLRASLSIRAISQTGTEGSWLVLKERGGGSSEPIHVTGKSVQALWNQTSDKVAVNFWSDAFSREFFILVRGSPERKFLDVSPAIAQYFPTSGVVRRVTKVHRWSKTGDLVVRCLTQKLEEPYAVFGCELLVSISGSAPTMTLLRGFIKE